MDQPTKKIILNSALWGWLGVVLLVADIFTKSLAEKYLAQPMVFFGGILKLFVSYNTGIAFSIPIPNLVMIIFTPLLLFLVTWLIFRTCDLDNPFTKLCLLLIVTGGIGNFLNRLWTGSVIDMISLSFWPSFNLADSYLTIGIFLIILFYGKISLKHDLNS